MVGEEVQERDERKVKIASCDIRPAVVYGLIWAEFSITVKNSLSFFVSSSRSLSFLNIPALPAFF